MAAKIHHPLYLNLLLLILDSFMVHNKVMVILFQGILKPIQSINCKVKQTTFCFFLWEELDYAHFFCRKILNPNLRKLKLLISWKCLDIPICFVTNSLNVVNMLISIV